MRILFSLLICLFSTLSYAASASDTLSGLLLNIHTLQADFQQTIEGKTARQSQGHMALVRPGKFYWKVSAPVPQVIIANGSRLWIYDPGLEQVTIRSFSKTTGQSPAFLLSDATLTLSKDYNVEEKGNQHFILVPKEKNSIFAEIKLNFSGKQIREMRFEDHLGHVTRIVFKNVILNSALSKSLFTFKPPQGVDVIDETKKS